MTCVFNPFTGQLDLPGALDTIDGANITSQRNGNNAQEYRLYSNYVSPTNYRRLSIKTVNITLSNVSGASVTASNFIPAGAFLIGITSRVATALGTANGTSGYSIGTAGDADLWGAIVGTAVGVSSDARDFTASGAAGLFTIATNVVVTAAGGNFNGTGVIDLSASYLMTEAD